MVEIFDSVVSEDARVPTLTNLPTGFGNVLAQFGGVVERWATAVPLVHIVVVPALLAVMRSCNTATFCLKRHKIYKYDAIRFFIGGFVSSFLKYFR
jgi:hypothetical protein